VRHARELLARGDGDIVDICTPQHLHFRQCIDALAAGRHVICEKPIAGSLAECDALIAAEASSGRRVMPVFQYRFGVGLQKLLHLVRQGVTGTHYVSTSDTMWRRDAAYFDNPWRGKRSAAMGGCLLTQAIHAHDAITLVAGPVQSIYGATATRVNDVETEDCAVASLVFADGALGSFAVTLGAFDETSRLRFCFEHLTAISSSGPYTMTAEPWTFIPANDAAKARIDAALADFEPQAEGFTGQFSRMATALASGADMPVTLADARVSLELLSALYHSAATGARVDLPIATDHPAYRGWLDAA
jgi:predicted dehydrogenase